MTNNRRNALAMLSINKDLTSEIRDFDDKIMEKFIQSKNRKIDFLYK